MYRPTEESLQHSCKTVNGHKHGPASAVREQQEQGSSTMHMSQGDHMLSPWGANLGAELVLGCMDSSRTAHVEPGPGATSGVLSADKGDGTTDRAVDKAIQHGSEVPSFDKAVIICM